MTGLAWALLAVTAVIAVVEWSAVQTQNRPLEYITKPATMVALIGVALALTPAVPEMRPWFVAALVCSLAGDVFLMIPKPETYFIPGLASFLVGHVLYIVGFIQGGVSAAGAVVGGVLVFTALVSIGPTLVKGASDVDSRLAFPVAIYMLTISVMVCVSIGAGVGLGIVGAFLFFVSDFCIGWSRFVKPFRNSNVLIMVTYHLAQILLVVSLVIAR